MNKRFVISKLNKNMINDTQTKQSYTCGDFTTERLLPLLNDFHEDNVRLKCQVEQLNISIDDLLTHTSCEELKKENERMEQECRQHLATNLRLLEHLELLEEKLFDKITQLKDENEQLKQKLENIGLNEKNDTVKMIDGKFFIRM